MQNVACDTVLLVYLPTCLLTYLLTYGSQSDLYQLYATDAAHSLPVLVFSSLANVCIVVLQFYWATLIVKAVQKMLGGGKSGKGGKAS